MKMRKVVATALVVAMLLSTAVCLDGCKKIEASDVMKNCNYFYTQKFECELPYEANNEKAVTKDITSYCVIGNSIFAVVNATTINADNPDDEMNFHQDIVEYSLENGKVLNIYDGQKLKESVAEPTAISFLELKSIFEENGKLRLFYFDDDISSGKMGYRVLKTGVLDSKSGTVKDYKTIADVNYCTGDYEEIGYASSPIIKTSEGYVLPVYSYLIAATAVPCRFMIFDSNGLKGSVDCSDKFPSDVYESPESFAFTGDGTIVGKCISMHDGKIEYAVNLNSMEFEINPDTSVIGDLEPVAVNDEISLAVSEEGVYIYKEGEYDRAVDFNFSDVNLYEAQSSKPVYCSDNMILLVPRTHNGELTILKITGSEDNPYEGKTKLTIADVNNNIDYKTSEAIRNFNKDNQDYYIEVKFYEKDSELEGLYALTDVTNRILVDMANGEAPDIILNAASYSEFNNSKYLLDLSSYISGDKDYLQNECYSKILDKSYTGDALYQLPLTFSVVGVRTKKSINEDYVFDFDEYNEYISSECNGVDPIADYIENNKCDYFVELLRGDMDLFVDYENRTVNFNTPEFIAAAEFVNSNHNIEAAPGKDFEDFLKEEWNVGKLDNEFGVYGEKVFLDETARMSEEVAICGTPSISGHGPMARIETSVSISADCSNPEGAWSFITYLYSPSTVEADALDMVSIDKASTVATANNIIDTRDEEIMLYTHFLRTGYFGGNVEQQLYNVGYYKLTCDEIDMLLDNLDAIDCIDCYDSAVMVIISEEMPAYFLGQKTLDDVISIINSRAQLAVTERG